MPVPGPVKADAGTGIGMLRLLPKTLPSDSILDDPKEKPPRHALAEFGLGVASAQANSDAYLNYERAIAEASPTGFSVDGKIPHLPGSLAQTALPDRPEPITSGLRTPSTPLVNFGAADGRVHTRWGRQLGPCAGQPIADSQVSVASIAAGAALPGKPLLDVSNTLRARSAVRLVDGAGQRGKQVRSTSTMRLASLRLFTGSETRIDVLSEPTLTATSSGDEATSSVDYHAPVLRISQNGEEFGVLDADHPELEVPTDLGLLQLNIGQPRQERNGAEIRARADMFSVRVLPAERLGSSAALAEMSFGELRATASAPNGGVDCSLTPAAAAPPAGPQPPVPGPPGALAPLLATGTGLLLLSGLLIAARRRSAGAHSV